MRWTVKSFTNPNVEYVVEMKDGQWTCSCPDFTFRKRICKHIVKVQQELSKPKYVEHPMVREGAIEERDYQKDIAKKALEANTLVVLPTALGKTVIAELVAAEVLHRYPGSRVMVLAPTKPLALQHRESFLKHLRLEPTELGVVTGEVNSREMIWENPSVRVVFGTPQAVWNDYRRGKVHLEEFALMVLDECHRSRERYAYTRLASEYVRRCPWPTILALTASPGSDEEKVMQVVNNLRIEQILWRTEDDEEVQRYIPGIRVSYVKIPLPEQYQVIRSEIRRAIESRLRELFAAGLLYVPMENVNRKVLVQLMAKLRAEIESGVRGANMHYMSLLSSILSLFHALELIESQHVHSLREYLKEVTESELRSHRMLARSPDFRRIFRLAEHCDVDHTKVDALIAVIEAHLREKPSDRVLVFANIRHTAEVLVNRLTERGLSATLFVGKAEGKGGPRMTQEEQMRVLREFREGKFNVLVATSIGEEGLDIPECGLVVFYEPTVSGIRHIQRKGRTGRKLPGKVVMLVTEETVDEYYFREGYRRAKRMADVLRKVAEKIQDRTVERKGPKPTAGEPWPWRREALVVNLGASGEVEVAEGEEGPSYSELYQCRKDIYLLLLKAGHRGMTLSEIQSSLEYDPVVVRMAVQRLVKEGKVVKIGERYALKAAIRGRSGRMGELMKVEVEKVYPGFAIVIINDRFRARLEPAMFYGVRDLIKKGIAFTVRGTVKKLNGKTTLIVHDVVSLS